MKQMKTLLIFLFLAVSPTYTYCYENTNTYNSKSAVVFMYHHFGDSRYPSTNIRLEQFENHLSYLKKNNYNIWPFSKIVRYLKHGKDIPSKTVALTMDDAYISVYTQAYPRLKKLGWPFTVFVNSNPVDSKFGNFMNWDQMREMKENGAEFANHSVSHGVMLAKSTESKAQWQNRITKEVQIAQKRLQEELGSDTNENPRLFSYPFGEYSMQTALLIKELGYVGISQTSGVVSMQSDFLALPRFAMSEAYGNDDGFLLKLQTKPLPIVSVSPQEPIVGKENPPILRIKLKHHLKDMNCYLSSGELVSLEWLSKTEVKIQAKEGLTPPRERYTCTARINAKEYYWYSHLWIIQK